MKRRELRLLVCMFGEAFVVAPSSSASAAIAPIDTWHVAAASGWVDSNGGVVTVTGTTVQKRTAAGSVVWTANLTSGFNFSHHLVFDSANNMYLDGFDDIRTDPASVTVVKVSSGGAVNWTKRYAVGAVNASE